MAAVDRGTGSSAHTPLEISDSDSASSQLGGQDAMDVDEVIRNNNLPLPLRLPPPPPNAEQRSPPDMTLPYWQPDAEVTYCPICHTQFSIFVRKHHCRKCGRVVCNACSPHRITIPYQYIVQPPGTPRLPAPRNPSALISGEGGFAEFSSLGGGESVRLCNPCVPDPNTTPPQTQDSAQQRAHGRPYSSSLRHHHAGNTNTLLARFSSYNSGLQSGDDMSSGAWLSRSSTMQPALASFSRLGDSHQAALPPHYQSSAAHRHRHPQQPQPQPRHQIAEEDECPICHRELPSRNLPNFEAEREAHITICITAHSAYTGGGGSPGGGSGGAGAAGRLGTSPRRTGMFPYMATEKDCVDSAECTICLEEFETQQHGYGRTAE
ncbi:hypothetical protein P8C59_007155 [Phyllachora maydis]|uniref:FYVE-type domain-containing protein n=1 Tax=Phyllachora maydis TaxID=1825666 RepID=A0AAD9MD93_9PEZI|nr:hypothetical protein P8C59_007155 [Phyllachora maydis]